MSTEVPTRPEQQPDLGTAVDGIISDVQDLIQSQLQLARMEIEADLRKTRQAASVVAAHNHVLRRHLRAETDDPVAEVEVALAQVVALFTPDAAATGGTSVVAFRTDRPLDEVLPALRRVLGDEAAPA